MLFRSTIEQTPGLSVWRGTETFIDLGGLENIKTYFRAVLAPWSSAPAAAGGMGEEAAAHLGVKVGDEVWVLPLE